MWCSASAKQFHGLVRCIFLQVVFLSVLLSCNFLSNSKASHSVSRRKRKCRSGLCSRGRKFKKLAAEKFVVDRRTFEESKQTTLHTRGGQCCLDFWEKIS